MKPVFATFVARFSGDAALIQFMIRGPCSTLDTIIVITCTFSHQHTSSKTSVWAAQLPRVIQVQLEGYLADRETNIRPMEQLLNGVIDIKPVLPHHYIPYTIS